MAKIYTLNKPQRAAAILVAMGKERAGVILKAFKSEELRAMIDAAHTLQTIQQPDLEELVFEFETEFAKGAGLIDSADEMQSILSDFMSDEELNTFIKKEQVDTSDTDNVNAWELLEKAEPENILAYLNKQPAQLAAIILKRLPPKTAASLIEQMEENMREPVLARMLSSRDVTDRVLGAIEKNLREEFKVNPNTGGSREAASNLAEILNEMDAATSDKIIGQLGARMDADKVDLVKSMMFRFEDVVHLEAADRTKLCDGLPTDLVTDALREAGADVAEAILSSLGQRTRRMIESELGGDAPVDPEKVTQARKSIATLALKMATEGQITLPEK